METHSLIWPTNLQWVTPSIEDKITDERLNKRFCSSLNQSVCSWLTTPQTSTLQGPQKCIWTHKNTWMLLENPFSFPQSKRTLPAPCVSLIQADASYFRIDLPNSGMVILDKPLDYETKTQLQVVIFAVVCSTCYSHMCWLAITRYLCAGKES